MNITLRWLMGLLGSLAMSAFAAAPEEPPDNDSSQLTELHFDDLTKLPVTSVAKRETQLFQSSAAISVVTHDDIRRLGITSIPEALRLVLGMDVARISANVWAISARGFNSQYASKLLVLIDGRTVYTPAFAGVYWSDQDLNLDDLARIEVIRGPGATLWGANAVNGVVNIITRRAAETQGLSLSSAFGTLAQPEIGVRHGGELAADLHYRAYGKYFDRQNFVDPAGRATPDDMRSIRGGFRLDWEPAGPDAVTLQGDYYSNDAGQDWLNTSLDAPDFGGNVHLRNANRGGNVLTRWTRHASPTNTSTLQFYYDRFQHRDTGPTETRNTFDLEWQQRSILSERQSLTWGLGYRYTEDWVPGTFYMSYFPNHRADSLYTGFLQHELKLPGRQLTLTLGSKLEHNDQTGYEMQPNVRLLWAPTEQQSLWASATRAVRTPSRFDTGSRVNFSIIPSNPLAILAFVSGSAIKPESVVAYELGYRRQAGARLSLDLATFYNVYRDVISYDAATPFFESQPEPAHLVIPLLGQNSVRGATYGAEGLLQWQATDDWQITAGYAWLRMETRPETFYVSPGDSPQQQFQLRSYLNLRSNLELNGFVSYTDRLPQRDIPSYVRVDLGVIWRARPPLEIGVWGQNLLDRRHPEFTDYNTPLHTEVPRSAMGRIVWSFGGK